MNEWKSLPDGLKKQLVSKWEKTGLLDDLTLKEQINKSAYLENQAKLYIGTDSNTLYVNSDVTAYILDPPKSHSIENYHGVP